MKMLRKSKLVFPVIWR